MATAVYYQSGKITTEDVDSAVLPDLIKKADVWIDYFGEISDDFFGLNLKPALSKFDTDELAEMHDGDGFTLIKVSYLKKDGTMAQDWMVLLPNSIISVHGTETATGSRGPIARFLDEIDAIVEDEKVNNFRDFALAHILDEIVMQNTTILGVLKDKMEEIKNTPTEDIEKANRAITDFSNLTHTISKVILSEQILLTGLRHGKGRYIRAENIAYYCEQNLHELAEHIYLRGQLEKEMYALIGMRSSKDMHEYTLQTARLNLAIELLTRASVLIMVPNSIFTLWPTLPFTANEVLISLPFWNVTSWELEIMISLATLAICQLWISWYYSRMGMSVRFLKLNPNGKNQ